VREKHPEKTSKLHVLVMQLGQHNFSHTEGLAGRKRRKEDLCDGLAVQGSLTAESVTSTIRYYWRCALWMCFWLLGVARGLGFGLNDSFSESSRPTTMSKPANEKVDKAILRLVSSIKIQDQPEAVVVVALQTAATICVRCGGRSMCIFIILSCIAAVNTAVALSDSIISYPYVSSCPRGSS
jgi:hypothetical protein